MGIWSSLFRKSLNADERTLLGMLESLRNRKRKAAEEQQREIEEAEKEVREALEFLKDKDDNKESS